MSALFCDNNKKKSISHQVKENYMDATPYSARWKTKISHKLFITYLSHHPPQNQIKLKNWWECTPEADSEYSAHGQIVVSNPLTIHKYGSFLRCTFFTQLLILLFNIPFSNFLREREKRPFNSRTKASGMQQWRNPIELKRKNHEKVIRLIGNLKRCRKKKKPPARLFCGASRLKTTWWKQKAESSAVLETYPNDQLWVFSQSFHAEPPLKVVTHVQLSRPLLKRHSFPLDYDAR